MASAATQPKAWMIPSNTGGGPRSRLQFSPDREGRVMLSDEETVVPLPLGTVMVLTLPRRETNDWYAEVKGARHVSGIGETQDEAFLAALAKAA